MGSITLALLVLAAPADLGLTTYDEAQARVTEVRGLLRITRQRMRAAPGDAEAAKVHAHALATWSVSERLFIQAHYALAERLHSWLGAHTSPCAEAWLGPLLARLGRGLAANMAAVAHHDQLGRARLTAASDVLKAYAHFLARRPRDIVAQARHHLRAMMDLDRRLMWFFELRVDGPLRRVAGVVP